MATKQKGNSSKPERMFSRLFRVFAWLDDFRERHRVLTKVFISAPIVGLTLWLIHGKVHLPIGGFWADFILDVIISVLISELFLRGIVPMQKYSWQATSMREMGPGRRTNGE